MISTPDGMTTRCQTGSCSEVIFGLPSTATRQIRNIVNGHWDEHDPSEGYRLELHAFLSCHHHRWTLPSPGPCPSSRLLPVESGLPMRESPSGALTDVLDRVRAEYREMPGLRLTPSQAQRLFQVEPAVCAALLNVLMNEHFLVRTANGLFVQSGTKE